MQPVVYVSKVLQTLESLQQHAKNRGVDGVRSLSQSDRALCKKVAAFVREGRNSLLTLQQHEGNQLQTIRDKIANAIVPSQGVGPCEFVERLFTHIGTKLYLRISSQEVTTLLLQMQIPAHRKPLDEEILKQFVEVGNFNYLEELLDLLGKEPDLIKKIICSLRYSESDPQMFDCSMQELLCLIRGIAPHQRVDLLTHIMPFLQNSEQPGLTVALLKTIALIPIADFITHAIPWLFTLEDSFVALSLLQGVATTPQDHRAFLWKIVPPLFQELSGDTQKYIFFEELLKIPPGQREQVMTLTSAVIKRFELSERVVILRAVVEIPEEVRAFAVAEASGKGTFEMFLSALANFRPPQPPEQSYNLYLTDNAHQREPIRFLHKLAEKFRESLGSKLSIWGQSGVDIGGVGRQFIGELFESLGKALQFKQIKESGLYRPQLQKNGSSEEKRVYYDLGQLIMFCLNATTEYPTGLLFDEGVFAAINAFPEWLLRRDFESLDPQNPETFRQLFAIYEKLTAGNESEVKEVKEMKRALGKPPSDYLFSIVQYEESIEALHLPSHPTMAQLEWHHQALFKALRQMIWQNSLRPALAPLHEIARGMQGSPFAGRAPWQSVRLMTPAHFSNALQGTASSEKIISLLEFSFFVPDSHRQWLKNWIANSSSDKVKNFLAAATGARSIGRNQIYIQDNLNSDRPAIYFHTCFHRVEVPFRQIKTEQDFISILESSLGGTNFNQI